MGNIKGNTMGNTRITKNIKSSVRLCCITFTLLVCVSVILSCSLESGPGSFNCSAIEESLAEGSFTQTDLTNMIDEELYRYNDLFSLFSAAGGLSLVTGKIQLRAELTRDGKVVPLDGSLEEAGRSSLLDATTTLRLPAGAYIMRLSSYELVDGGRRLVDVCEATFTVL